MTNDLDLLGSQLTLALRFWESDFNRNLLLIDTVAANQNILAKDLFIKRGRIWHMRPDSIPGNLTIKSIGINQYNIYRLLELT